MFILLYQCIGLFYYYAHFNNVSLNVNYEIIIINTCVIVIIIYEVKIITL